jgi:SNF family Na+-dependent transporter
MRGEPLARDGMARESWASRAGFILAAVGSAIGLGNIWRFPWMTAENGGSAFLLLYLLIVLLVGVPGLLAAFVIGRRSNRNPVGAFRSLAGSRAWTGLGVLCVVTAILLMSFYSVVGGGSSGTSSRARRARTSPTPGLTSRRSATAPRRSPTSSPSSQPPP